MKLLKFVRCMFGYHEPYIAFSWKSGAYESICTVCGRTLDKRGSGGK